MGLSYSDFEKYYDAYKHKIFNYLFYRSGKNRAIAEDLTGDVFLKALEKFQSYKPDQSFQAWIYAIAHNHLVDYYRKGRTTVDLAALENVIESDIDPRSSLMKRVAAEEVQELLQHLVDEEKEIILMRYLQDLPLKEIAEIVDRPEPTVRVIVHRAFAKLRSKYATLYATFTGILIPFL